MHQRLNVLAATLATAMALSAHAMPSTAGDIPHRSGGIGQNGVQEMKAAASAYSAGLTFANPSGAYLANVSVTIKDGQGKELLSTVTQGPMLLVDLPPGNYTVDARFEGRSATRQLSVPAQGHRQAVIHL